MDKETQHSQSDLFDYVARLSERELLIVNALDRCSSRYPKNSIVFREEDPSEHFYMVEEGVCFTHRHLEDGSRQIIDIYFPGEIVALDELSRSEHGSGLTTLSESVLTAYNKTEVTQVFCQSPVLSRLFINMISREQVNLTERLVGLARYCARQRTAHFLLEIRHRIERSKRTGQRRPKRKAGKIQDIREPTHQAPNVVRLPQAVIADALGLSVVHVSRVLGQFRDEGHVDLSRPGITLLNITGLESVAGTNSKTRLSIMG
ncbi:MAG: Crp/Fnr family transcriptional regulator [Marinobacter sp.]|uniref:Crp/Fnr family transcriptional regulator n=1 Tax=Marinobacter sp. TaxID=50741 RepID=UPI0034A0180B